MPDTLPEWALWVATGALLLWMSIITYVTFKLLNSRKDHKRRTEDIYVSIREPIGKKKL
jgi:hypothetical protein